MPAATSSPLIVGVSGHRDLHVDQAEAARAAVAEFLSQLAALVPNTEIRVAVGMAEGADLLVARLALERNLAVDAVLPMPLADYAADFSGESLAQLHELLAHPRVRRIELPPVSGTRAGDAVATDRDALYANLSDYLERRSSVLIALWDGTPSPLTGGTADTLLRYLSARASAPVSSAIDFVDNADHSGTQFVYWVPVGRRSGSNRNDNLQPCYLSGVGENLLCRHAAMPHELERQFAGLDHYNRVYGAMMNARPITPDSLLSRLPPEQAPPPQTLQALDAEYGKADALAVYYQHRSDRLFRFSSYMAALIALLFVTYAELSGSRLLLIGYLVTLLAGVGLYYGVASRNWFANHLACRVLAETLRTKFFLRLADAEHLVDANQLIDLTGINQFSDAAWIKSVLRSVEPVDPAQHEGAGGSAAQLEYVHRAWIVDQHDYFRSRVSRLERTNHRLEKTKNRLVYVMVLVAIVLVLFANSLHHAGDLLGASLEHWLVFFMGLLPIWLGTWEIYQHKMATRELLWQYRNQLGYFARAREQLKRAASPQRRTAIIADLGRESLVESYLWMIHRYHREHEPPASG